ncbi:MAG: HPr kinase/phosphorylase [Allosphingosinicella sp.]
MRAVRAGCIDRVVACQVSVFSQSVGRRYRAHGFVIESEIVLPQLPLAPEGSEPDLRIRIGTVPSGRESRPGYRRWQVFDQFRYEVVEGRDIIVEPLPDHNSDNVTDAVMSRVLTVAIYQRGRLPLHASAVELDGRLVAICGPSGAGKSTLAAAFVARGARVVTDDMLVLDGECGPLAAWPGACGLKLSEASLAQHGRTSYGLALSNKVEGKYFLPLVGGDTTETSPLSLLIELRAGPAGIAPVPALQAASRSAGCIRMTDLMHVAHDTSMLWHRWLDLAASVPVVALSHGRELAALDGLVAQIEAEHLLSDGS